MNSLQVDALYHAFVDSLPVDLRPIGADLPYVLRLAPLPGLRFSEVFSHEVTLSAPAMVAEAFPQVTREAVRFACMAHALAVIEAFGTDRVADQQIEGTSELTAVLEHLRRARDLALERVFPGASSEAAAADVRSRDAIRTERELLRQISSVDFGRYDQISLHKQAVGFPASLALGRAVGATAQQLAHVERALAGTWLGIQFEDDVIDWEDDWRAGGAWAACIARSLRSKSRGDERPTEPDLVRRAVLGSNVLLELLERSRRRYRSAWRHAAALGARRLARWAVEREGKLKALIPLEAQFAGYAVRMRRLKPWAAEVLT